MTAPSSSPQDHRDQPKTGCPTPASATPAAAPAPSASQPDGTAGAHAGTPALRLHPLQKLVFSLMLMILVGWLLKVGQNLLLPVFMALISVYVLVELAELLRRLPLLRQAPQWLRRLLVLGGFIGISALFTSIIVNTAEEIMRTAPTYQSNLAQLVEQASAWLGIQGRPDWKMIRSATLDKINLQRLIGAVFNSISSLAGIGLMVIIYAMFLLGERGTFAHKLSIALPDDDASHTHRIIADINQKIGAYLAIKTLVNMILAAISWGIMLVLGVDFALFWAIVIGLLNYIPYVGSFLGVVFPVLLTLADSGSMQSTLLVLGCLGAAQFFVGNVLEPRMIGKQVNLSPVVVLMALSLWYSLWGVAGAILAIPLTSMLAIILASFQATRPVAIMLAQDVRHYQTPANERNTSARLP